MKKTLTLLLFLVAAMSTLSFAADPCSTGTRKVSVINLTASGQIVTAPVGQTVYVCYLQFSLNSTADNVALVEGTGSTCGTGTVGMAGGPTAATGWNLLANGSVTSGIFTAWVFSTANAGDNVCLLASSAAQISGVMIYVTQ